MKKQLILKRICAGLLSIVVISAGSIQPNKKNILVNNIEAQAAWSSVSELQNYALANWTKPIRASYLDPNGGARYFGANRSGTTRKHAGNDYVCDVGTPVYAMTGGYVQEYSSNFMNDSSYLRAISVKNDDGSVVRYCEIETSLRNGSRVEKGQQIGVVKINNSGRGMLHLELYLGTASGSLSNTSNHEYWYVSYKNYCRRPDLLDPAFLQKLGEPILPNDDELGIPYPRASGSPVLKSGSRSSDVSWLQSALNKLGYGLNVDGQFGTLTENAVKDFQSANGLSVDGKVGVQTIGKLVEKVKEKINPPIPPEPVKVVPSQPTLNVGAGTNYSKTKLNWNNCDNTDWYDIRIYKSDGTNILSLFNQHITSYTIPLTAGNYYANIASVNSNGNYTFSSDVSFTVSEGTITPVVRKSFNGHIYAVYDANVWYDRSKDIAEKTMGGHLVTITSAEEDDFVQSLIANGKYEHYWIGGSDAASEGNFKWSTGEAMSYTHWTAGEPNNSGGSEHYMEKYKSTGLWNDNRNDCDGTGFIVEIENITELTTDIYNGNQYSVFEGNMTWTEARTYCEMLGGHLAYVGDAKENEFIKGLISGGQKGGYWLGGEEVTRGGTYQWTDGSLFGYSNFGSGQPDHYQGTEHYLEMYKYGTWNDNCNVAGRGFVCEFESTFSKTVTLESKTDTEIGISWSGARFADGYNIYVDGRNVGTTKETSYTITGLDSFTNYEIYVEMIAKGVPSDQTDIIEVMTAQEVTFSGKGTAGEPYLISTEDDLYCMAAMVNDPFLNNGFGTKYYQQTNDITMSGGMFLSIGSAETPFKGVYDGGFYSIKNVSSVNGGIFGQIGADGGGNEAIVRNLEIKGSIYNASGDYTGGITGKLCGNSKIENCAVIGDVEGTVNAGGIAGMMKDGATIINCYHNGAVSSEESSGGIVGVAENGSITNTYHSGGNVSGALIGGIVGTVGESINVQNSFYLKSTAGSSTISGAIAANETVMKELSVTLGESFANDYDSINNGYPVLVWQNGLYEFKGSGTANDPYQINCSDDFIQMANYINSDIFNSRYGNAHYIQNVDIILNDIEWTPIGKHWEVPFIGEYDGNAYSIYGLNAGGNVYGGLFGRVGSREASGSGYIHNVTVVNGSANCNNVDGKSGGIVAVVACGAKVEDCAFIGSVNGVNNVGGVVGMITEGGTVNNCYQTGTVKGEVNVGGVVGTSDDGNVKVTNSYHAGGNITATKQYGGISGAIGNGTKIDNCYYLRTNASYGVNGSGNSGAMAVNSSVLKLLADDLGDAYSENVSEYFNQGYPVFAWQDFSKANNPIMGDVNDDGEFNVSDVVMLQKWLLCAGPLTNWENGDFCADERIDVFDLCLMKRALVESGIFD